SFSLWLVMTWTYVDLAVLALSTLAFSLVNVWRETKDSRWLILLGFLCGFSLTIKYTVGLLIGALGLYILVYQPLRNVLRQPHQLIRDVLFFGLPIIVAFLPWMIRAALHYNNPFYPYFFDGLNWNSDRALYFNQVGMGLLSHNLWWQLPIMPIAATIFGVDNAEPYAFTASPWLLTLPLLLLVDWKWVPERARRLVLGGALLEIPMFIVWALLAANVGIAMQTRLMIMALPISSVLGAISVDALAKTPEKPIHISCSVRVSIVLTMVFGLKE